LERPPEIRQALRNLVSYIDQLEADLESERRGRQLAELKLKAAKATAAPKERPAPAKVTGEGDVYSEAMALLELTGKPSELDIRKAYRRLARSHHPDADGGSSERFQALTAAQQLLLLRVS